MLAQDSASTLPQAALLQSAGALNRTRALLIGPRCIEILCALIGGGCIAATEMRLEDRAEPQSVDLVIVPYVASLEAAHSAIAQAHRALLPTGRLVLHAARLAGMALIDLENLLRRLGFSAIRLRMLECGAVLSAELPWFGAKLRA